MSARKVSTQAKSSTSARSASVAGGSGVSRSPKKPGAKAPGVIGTDRPTLKPPLERALVEFGGELRKELEKTAQMMGALNAELAELRTDLAELRARFDSHTHPYKSGRTGSGGHLWFSLGQIRHYVEDDETGWSEYGTYLREAPATGDAPDIQTGPPA